MSKLDAKAMGLALGIIWAAAMIILGIVAMFFDYGRGFVQAIGSLYIGYKPTLVGSIIGAVWGFLDAGIFGVILAWLYNKLAK
jgi:hypothetical protein